MQRQHRGVQFSFYLLYGLSLVTLYYICVWKWREEIMYDWVVWSVEVMSSSRREGARSSVVVEKESVRVMRLIGGDT